AGMAAVERIGVSAGMVSEEEVLQYMVSLNQHSEHPLAAATLDYGKSKNIKALETRQFEAVSGMGVKGMIGEKTIGLGNRALLTSLDVPLSVTIEEEALTEQRKGKTLSFLTVGNEVAGYVVISDQIKASSKKAIDELQQHGIDVVMFTGDNPETAASVAEELGLSEFKAEMLP